MKKLIALLMALAALTSFAMAESYDFSTYDTRTLNEIDVAIRSELLKRAVSSVSTLSHDAAYEKEIMFRGIPWGANYDDARQMLIGSGFFTDKCKLSSSHYLRPWSIDPNGTDFYYDCGVWLEQSSSPDNIQVAGYKVGKTELHFMYTLDGDKIKRDTKDVELFKVRMELKATDYALSFVDLVGKLNSVYGQGDEWSEVDTRFSGETTYENWAAWYGANNTSVLLHMYYKQENDTQIVDVGWIELYYGKTDSEPQIVAIAHALENEKKEIELQKMLENASNVDGL